MLAPILVLLNRKEGFESEFKSCIDTSLTEEEFDSSWQAMIDTHELQENKYMHHLYEQEEVGPLLFHGLLLPLHDYLPEE